jgi:integrase
MHIELALRAAIAAVHCRFGISRLMKKATDRNKYDLVTFCSFLMSSETARSNSQPPNAIQQNSRRPAIILIVVKDSLAGLRDCAVLLLGFASAMRRSELVGLNVSDLKVTKAGIRLHSLCDEAVYGDRQTYDLSLLKTLNARETP